MHLLMMVIGADPDEQLAPFQENTYGTCPEQYLKFHDVEDEFRETYRTGVFDDPWAKHQGRAIRPLREEFPTFDNYMAEAYGPRDERTGRYGEWFNPNSQYDWYVPGGRFAGHLILKPGRTGWLAHPDRGTPHDGRQRADSARVGDIDFTAMSGARHRRLLAARGELERTGRTDDRRAKWQHDIPETVTTLERLVEYAGRPTAHNGPDGVVFNGEWATPCWIQDDTPQDEAAKWGAWFVGLVASLPGDTLLSVIDCHTV